MKIDSRSNLIRLMRRFVETNEIFAKRFATNLNKHFDYYINEKIIELCEEMIKLIKCFDSYINYQINEKTIKSKIANINY